MPDEPLATPEQSIEQLVEYDRVSRVCPACWCRHWEPDFGRDDVRYMLCDECAGDDDESCDDD
jgi:hypothetical protein